MHTDSRADLRAVQAHPLAFTVITSVNPLSKVMSLRADGALARTAAANMTAGVADARVATDLHDLLRQLEALGPNQAPTWGVTGHASVPIVTLKAQPHTPGAIARAREFFHYPDGPGVLMLDFDGVPPGWPMFTDPDTVRGLLLGACPALDKAPMLIRPSSSAGIIDAQGRVLAPLSKWRAYIPVTRAADIPEAGRRLFNRLWASGFGWWHVGNAGQLLERTIIDAAVWEPERLDFVAPPELRDGLRRVEFTPAFYGDPAGRFDLAGIELPDDLAASAEEAKRAARVAAAPAAAQRRSERASELAPLVAERVGKTVEVVAATLRRDLERGELSHDFPLTLQGGAVVTVGELLANPETYPDGMRMPDPLDPDYRGDDRIARLHRDGARPNIFSHRGQITYWLHQDPAVIFAMAAGPLPAAVLPLPPAPGADVTTVVPLDCVIGEDALALAFAQRYGHTYRWSPGLGWMAHTGQVWARDLTLTRFGRARELCRTAASAAAKDAERRMFQSAKTVAGVLSLAQSDPRLTVHDEAWDADPFVLNTPAGALDLRTGAAVDRSAHYLTHCTNITPDFAAGAPVFTRFIAEVFTGDADLIGFVQRLLGYCATGDRREQILAFWHGTGANGKSTLLDLVQWMLGSYALKLPASTLMTTRGGEAHPTGIAQLRGKRLAVSSELDEGQHFNEPLVKELTGDEALTARFMRGDFFSFTQTQKHLIVGNYRPRLRGGDPAIARRLLLVPFEAVFAPGKRDAGMPDKLRAEAPAILAWIIRGAMQWHAGGLGVPERVRAASADYMEAHDDIEQWLEERCEREGKTKAGELYTNFRAWKAGRGEFAPSMTAWGERMQRLPWLERRKSGGVIYSPLRFKTSA